MSWCQWHGKVEVGLHIFYNPISPELIYLAPLFFALLSIVFITKSSCSLFNQDICITFAVCWCIVSVIICYNGKTQSPLPFVVFLDAILPGCRAAKLAEILINVDACSFVLNPLFNFLPMKSEKTDEVSYLPNNVCCLHWYVAKLHSLLIEVDKIKQSLS